MGVSPSATQEEIRSAYRKLIRETHPDINPDPEAAEKFMQIQEAFRWLSDPGQREVYDGVGGKFGEDAIYDYTDEPILGSLNEIQEIPLIKRATEIVNALRRRYWAKQVRQDLSISCYRKRFRKWGCERIMFARDFINKELQVATRYIDIIQKLHPFERLSVELTLAQHKKKEGVTFGKLVGAIKLMRQRITEILNAHAHGVKVAERGRLATFYADNAIEDIMDLVFNHAPVLQQFREAQYYIYKTPVIDLDKPTVVFAGPPNVGKSSLVRSLSTGRPEVSNYMFTTKQLTIGHLWHFIAGTPLLVHGQLVDTPGLRSPPGGDHNLLDQLTLGSMEHLPTAVVFVFDPNPLANGLLSLSEQIDLRDALRDKFPRRPWLDVVTKCDLIEPEAVEGMATLTGRYPEALLVSSMDGTGLAELNMEVRRMLETMTRVVRQLQRAKIRQLRAGVSSSANPHVSKAALSLREQ